VNIDLLLAVRSRCMQAAAGCMLHADFRDSKDSAFRRSLSQMADLGWLAFAAAMADCLEPRGDGFTASLGPVRLFALVRGDDGDLPGTNASHEPSFARITSAKRQRTAVLTPGTAHFELRQFGHLAANGSILETDTPRQAAGWRFLL
jgi:hypothetical protein